MATPRLVRVGSIESTQDLARGLPVGSAVVADHQTAGRGRLGRRWEAPPRTALLASFVLPFSPLGSLAAGVAVAEACGPACRLKWPNDVLLDGRKLAGILVEVQGPTALVGVGVNLTWAPPEGAMLGPAVDRDELLGRLHESLREWMSAPAEDVLERWRALSATLGREVLVELPGESFAGVAEDIADDGSLIVGGRAVAAGDVRLLRDAPAPAAPPPSGP